VQIQCKYSADNLELFLEKANDLGSVYENVAKPPGLVPVISLVQ
jgi:hypothetical protein